MQQARGLAQIHDQRLAGAFAQHAAHHHLHLMFIRDQPHAVAHLQPQVATRPHRFVLGKLLSRRRIGRHGFFRIRRFLKRRQSLRQHIHAQQGNHAPGQNHVIFDPRTQLQRVRQQSQLGQHLRRHSSHRGDLEIGASGQRVHRRMERSCRRASRQFDGQHRGHAQCHGHHREQCPQWLLAQWTQDQAVKQRQEGHEALWIS